MIVKYSECFTAECIQADKDMGKGGQLQDRDDNKFIYSFQASRCDMGLYNEGMERCAGLVLVHQSIWCQLDRILQCLGGCSSNNAGHATMTVDISTQFGEDRWKDQGRTHPFHHLRHPVKHLRLM